MCTTFGGATDTPMLILRIVGQVGADCAAAGLTGAIVTVAKPAISAICVVRMARVLPVFIDIVICSLERWMPGTRPGIPQWLLQSVSARKSRITI